jgi:hypothetical protein
MAAESPVSDINAESALNSDLNADNMALPTTPGATKPQPKKPSAKKPSAEAPAAAAPSTNAVANAATNAAQ